MKRRIQSRIEAGEAGRTVIDFLAARFTYHTREQWMERIAAGRLRVNESPAGPECVLAAGDAVEYIADDIAEPAVPLDVGILHDDADVLVVNKPAGLPCHPAGRYFRHTLWAVLKERCGVDDPSFVNRLDRETSGIVVVARTPASARKLRAQFTDRRVEKRYLALVEGVFPEAAVNAAGFLGPGDGEPVRKRRLFRPATGGPAEVFGAAPAGCEWAETRLRRMAVHGPISEVEAIPKTGRLHQIRATLSGLGFPIVGDKVYGVDPGIFVRFCTDAMTDVDRERMRMGRQALHAAGLRFRHPSSNRPMEFDLPMPADMRALTELLTQAMEES